MHFRISHETRYTYERPIFLQPHTLRLTPRGDWNQHLEEFTSTFAPQPVGIAHNVDIDGNATLCLWFDGLHESLSLTTQSTVTTVGASAFEYLIAPFAETLPFDYPESLAVLQVYRKRQTLDGDVEQLGARLVDDAAGSTTAFLTALNQHLNATCETETRIVGDPLEAAETWRRKRGACRDLTVLFMEVCRSVGLAARFVSGYEASAAAGKRAFMHAWAEVYVPGAGWRGYDPSGGLVVTDQHVALASGPSAAHADPVEGSYRGTGVGSTMEVDIEIEVS